MSQRIRYGKVVDGITRSVKTFNHPTNGEKYIITLDETNKKFVITEAQTNLELASGAACNLHQVKIKAKKALENLLGFVFEVEDRSSRAERAHL